MQAVHLSRIEPRFRHLAQTLAIFANDAGQEIWPGVSTLKQALGVEERAVHEGLQALIDRGVLERDGYRGHRRRFRYNLGKLSGYEPLPERTRAARRDAARQREARKRVQKTSSQPCTTVQGYPPLPEVGTLHHGAINPAPRCGQPCTTVRPTLHSGAPDLYEDPDPYDKNGKNERATGAVAPGLSQTEKEEENPPEEIPFERYAAIATRAIECAVHERDDSIANVKEHFRRLCAQQHLSYDTRTVQKATDAARVAQIKASRKFNDQLKLQIREPAHAPPTRRAGRAQGRLA